MGDENADLLAQMMEAFRASDFPQEGLPEMQAFLTGALADCAREPEKLAMIAIMPLTIGDLASVRSLLERAKSAGSVDAALGIAGGAAEYGHEALALEALDAAEAMGFADGESERVRILLTTENVAAARPLLEKRAKDGDARSAYILARILEADEPDQAMALLQRAYELGSGDAAFRIGLLTHDDPSSEDFDTWIDRAIDLGCGDALLMRGLKLGEDDRQAGEPFLRRAVEEFEHGAAARELGVWEREAGNTESALQLFHRAAEFGNTTAMYDLGVYHEHRMERDQAREWYEKGAEAGDDD
ncbi:MAG: tetratricopeptide repeat protein, partial [Gaiellales bacterium]